jgi:hypothetical protein
MPESSSSTGNDITQKVKHKRSCIASRDKLIVGMQPFLEMVPFLQNSGSLILTIQKYHGFSEVRVILITKLVSWEQKSLSVSKDSYTHSVLLHDGSSNLTYSWLTLPDNEVNFQTRVRMEDISTAGFKLMVESWGGSRHRGNIWE